jgi:hypothetical protein
VNSLFTSEMLRVPNPAETCPCKAEDPFLGQPQNRSSWLWGLQHACQLYSSEAGGSLQLVPCAATCGWTCWTLLYSDRKSAPQLHVEQEMLCSVFILYQYGHTCFRGCSHSVGQRHRLGDMSVSTRRVTPLHASSFATLTGICSPY